MKPSTERTARELPEKPTPGKRRSLNYQSISILVTAGGSFSSRRRLRDTKLCFAVVLSVAVAPTIASLEEIRPFFYLGKKKD